MDSNEILDMLLKQGVISRNNIEELETSDRNPKFKQAVEAYHALMCSADHDYDCMFHEEAIKQDTWERTAHLDWAKRVRRIIQHYDISIDIFLTDIQGIGAILSRHDNLSGAGREMFKELFTDPESL